MPITQLIDYMMPAFNMFCEKYNYTMVSVDQLANLPIYVVMGEELDRFYAAQDILAPYGTKVMDTITMDTVRDHCGSYTPVADHTIMVFNPECDTLVMCLIHEMCHYIQVSHSLTLETQREERELEVEDAEDMLFDYYDPEEMDVPRRAMLAVAQSMIA